VACEACSGNGIITPEARAAARSTVGADSGGADRNLRSTGAGITAKEFALMVPTPQCCQRSRQARDVVAAAAGKSIQAPAKSSTSPCVTCDKCDGPHPTDDCPHFKKKRETHKDAWVNFGRKHPLQMAGSGGNFTLRNGRCIRQPGDGSCLFHSLCFGLNGGSAGVRMGASELRRQLAHFIARNPLLEVAGDTLEEWVRWDANLSVSAYARRMAVSGWGGGIEMVACSLLKKVNIHVYEGNWFGRFKRISCFDSPTETENTIHVLYQGGVHYDAIAVG